MYLSGDGTLDDVVFADNSAGYGGYIGASGCSPG